MAYTSDDFGTFSWTYPIILKCLVKKFKLEHFYLIESFLKHFEITAQSRGNLEKNTALSRLFLGLF